MKSCIVQVRIYPSSHMHFVVKNRIGRLVRDIVVVRISLPRRTDILHQISVQMLVVLG